MAATGQAPEQEHQRPRQEERADPSPRVVERAPHRGGWVARGFEEVRVEFDRNFVERGEIGAAVAAYWRGEKVVDLWGGRRTPDRRRAVERGHDGRRQFDDEGSGGDDGCRRELARLDRLRRAGRRVLARVRPERQGCDHRAPAAQSRSGVGLDRRGAAGRGLEGPRQRVSATRATEASVGAGNATRLPRDDDRALHAGVDPPRRSGAPHARPVLPRGDRGTSADRVLHRTPSGDSRRAARGAEALHSPACHASAA